ncbi:MAG: hypothetical protein LBR60_06835 [Fibrobacter sp.]|jgi:hypothetical protein|nr:hypothetical protein [Fibrobacter sp.]
MKHKHKKALDRLKKFMKKIKGLKTWQKVLLLAVAVVLPAGILIATMALAAVKKR